MKIKVLTAIVLLLVFTRSTAQSTAYSIDTVATTGANDKLESFYFTLQPQQPSKGLLVIIPGFMTPPQEMMKETRLHDAAVAKGYTVLIPFLILPNATETMGLVQRRLEIIVTNAMKKYRIPVGKLVIGGHSIGGLYAMCYAETTQKPGHDSLVKPAAVFGVDPPLDLKRLYNGYDRAMKEGVGLNSEATMITERFRKIFGGTPQQESANYEKESAYTADAAQGGNTHYLKNMPVRLYCDPDINWFIRERQTSVAWLNLADLTGCIVALNKMGNKKAELITALGKGYLPNGTRHPHAFSLLDADECVTWFNRILYPHDK